MRKYREFILVIFLLGTNVLAQSRIKWEETFDGTVIPNGWQVIDADGSGHGWEFVQSDTTSDEMIILLPQAGRSFFTGNVQDANLAGVIDEWLISPRISVIYAGDSLYFWAGAIDQLFADSLRVFVSTTTADLSSFQNRLGYFKVDGPAGTWHRYGFDLSPFDSSDIYFAVNYYIADGGPGGQNSDFIWFDHPLISGDPSTLNHPPSAVVLQAPADKGLIDDAVPSVDFRWSASRDIDGEDLTYTLTIVNTFPPLSIAGLADTLYSLNWAGLLDENTLYRWTVEVTDGKSKVSTPDTFSFKIVNPATVNDQAAPIADRFILYQNYPNPFNSSTIIKFQIPYSGFASLKIYNSLGQKVATLWEGRQEAGTHTVRFDGSALASGVYLCRLEGDNGVVQTRKIVIIK